MNLVCESIWSTKLKKEKEKKSKRTLLSKLMELIFCLNQTEVNTFTAKFWVTILHVLLDSCNLDF